jgi:hypothetical protein
VEELTFQIEALIFEAIFGVADDGVADVTGVHTNLVSAASFQFELHEGVATVTREDGEMRHGTSAAAVDGHLLAVGSAAGEGLVDDAAVGFDDAFD